MIRRSRPQRVLNLEQAWRALQPPCVLVAEDDDEARALLARALRQAGCRVVEARDGRELQIALEGAPEGCSVELDVVVSDVRMPGPNGLDVLRGVRERGCSIPFIVITAFGDEQTHREAARVGATAILDKPFDTDDLLTVVLDALRPARDG